MLTGLPLLPLPPPRPALYLTALALTLWTFGFDPVYSPALCAHSYSHEIWESHQIVFFPLGTPVTQELESLGHEDCSLQFNVNSGYGKLGPQLHLLPKKLFDSFGGFFSPWNLNHGRYPFGELLGSVPWAYYHAMAKRTRKDSVPIIKTLHERSEGQYRTF